MPRKSKSNEESPLPEELTTAQCVQLTGISERRFFELIAEGKIPKPETPGQYPAAGTIRAIIEYYQEMARGLPAQTAADRARQARADADTAEIRAAKEIGTLVLRSDCRRVWSGGFVKIREAILKFPGLRMAQRVALADMISKVKPDFESLGQ